MMIDEQLGTNQWQQSGGMRHHYSKEGAGFAALMRVWAAMDWRDMVFGVGLRCGREQQLGNDIYENRFFWNFLACEVLFKIFSWGFMWERTCDSLGYETWILSHIIYICVLFQISTKTLTSFHLVSKLVLELKKTTFVLFSIFYFLNLVFKNKISEQMRKENFRKKSMSKIEKNKKDNKKVSQLTMSSSSRSSSSFLSL